MTDCARKAKYLLFRKGEEFWAVSGVLGRIMIRSGRYEMKARELPQSAWKHTDIIAQLSSLIEGMGARGYERIGTTTFAKDLIAQFSNEENDVLSVIGHEEKQPLIGDNFAARWTILADNKDVFSRALRDISTNFPKLEFYRRDNGLGAVPVVDGTLIDLCHDGRGKISETGRFKSTVPMAPVAFLLGLSQGLPVVFTMPDGMTFDQPLTGAAPHQICQRFAWYDRYSLADDLVSFGLPRIEAKSQFKRYRF